jgi:hypothetical protein
MHRIKLFEALGQESQLDALQKVMAELAERISTNDYFKTLDSGKQKNIKNGKVAYLKPLEEIAEQTGMTVSDFRYFHVFFSTHVHGLPMSFYRIGEDRGRGLPTELESSYTAMCLGLTANLVIECIAEMEELFKDALKDREMEAEVAVVCPPEPAPNLQEMAHGLAQGEVKQVYESAMIRIEAVGLSETEAALIYFEPIMGEKVLRESIAETGRSLAFVDPVYWNIDVNNEPVTDRLLDELIQADHLFKIDLSARQLRFKAPIEALKAAREKLADLIKTEPQYPKAKPTFEIR